MRHRLRVVGACPVFRGRPERVVLVKVLIGVADGVDGLVMGH